MITYRRFAALAAVVGFISLLVLGATAQAQQSTASGDASCDGVVEAADAAAVLGYLVAPGDSACFAGSTAIDQGAADLSASGTVDLLDALLIAQQTASALPLRAQIIATYPHDNTSFTQGLEFVNGELIESAGLFGQSDLRRVDPTTGAVLHQVATPDGLFAEGVTRVQDRLIQLTWKAGRAFVWNAETFAPMFEIPYAGEGWGLCFDGDQLVMSDGSASLQFRDPGTFLLNRQVQVTSEGDPVTRLNELECVGGVVWANIWQTNTIVRIEPVSGEVTATVDLADLLQPRPAGVDVLNGIAFDSETSTFWITGKLWPTMFQVRFVPELVAG